MELGATLADAGIRTEGQALPHLLMLAELARRYLRGHGPATAADLAAWSGLPLRDARTGLATIARELERDAADVCRFD